jgi:methylenetetrahydrofolate reductase (NADPH)
VASSVAPVPSSISTTLQRLARDSSFELTPGDALTSASVDALAPGTRIFLPALPSAPFEDTLRAAERLAAAGHVAVPHVAVRTLPDVGAVERRLAALAGAGIGELLLIAGSIAAAGRIVSTLEVLESGLLEAHGIRRVGVAGHPEGSPEVAGEELDAALAAKNEIASRGRLSLYVVTQFCFAPEPYVLWERLARARGSRLPVRAGLPGLTSMSRLLRYGLACGVGPSLQRLRKQTGVLRLATGGAYAPDAIAAGIARAAAADPGAQFEGLHFFPFGGVERTVEWALALRDGRFELHDDDRIVINPQGSRARGRGRR